MSARGARRVAVVAGVIGLAIAACVEDVTSPAQCPDFCPSGQIATVESLLATAVGRDSTFRGYVEQDEADVMLAATLPQLDSRPIFQTLPIATRFKIDTGSDTTTGPIVVDSVKLSLTLFRRDTAAHNLRLAFYRLPLGLDSTSTFAGLAPAFAAAPMRVVNFDSLLAKPGLVDSTTGDRVLSVDSVRHAVTVSLKFDTTQLSFVETDSGKVAIGVRVTADSLASVALGASEAGTGPRIVWFNSVVDSAGTLVPKDSQPRGLLFDGFVFDPPAPAFDSNHTVGGVPSARALLRFTLPRGIRDSSQIIRATLLLVPVAPASGVPVDSFFLSLSRVAGDFGFKSPIVVDSFTANSPLLSPGGASADTVRIEVTRLLRAWQLDTTAATAAYLRLITLDRVDTTSLSGAEGTTLTALRLYSSRTPAFRPGLHVTFVPRFQFGVP